MKCSREHGNIVLIQDVLLWGVCLCIHSNGLNTGELRHGETAWRVIERESGGGLLMSEDCEYAERAPNTGGMLDISRATVMDDKMHPISRLLPHLRVV